MIFEGFDLERGIAERARGAGLDLSDDQIARIAEHARILDGARDELALTSIRDPGEFLERHIGESLEGAALLPEEFGGSYFDLGSGNGYPALPLSIARPGLALVMVEASSKKAEFLRGLLARVEVPGACVFEGQVQRPADLATFPDASLITMRAMGGWEKIVPRMAGKLGPDGRVLLWAGSRVSEISGRTVWRRFSIENRHPLPGREESWIWTLRAASGSTSSPSAS